MKGSTVWLLNVSAASAMAVLILLTYLCLDQVRTAVWFNDRVDHTYQVILESEKMMSRVREAETGLRGYLLTNNERFLQSYHDARDAYEVSMQRMDSLSRDNVHQLRRLGIIRSLLRDNWRVTDENIRLSSQKKVSKTIEQANVLKGKATMDAVKSVVQEMQQEERRILDGRMSARERKFNLTPAYLLVLAFLAGGLLVLSAFFLHKELRRRVQTQKDLEKKVEELNRSNAELEQFAYVASHDLQEPLRKIRAFADRLLMKQRDGLTEEGKIMLDKISGSAERMQGLINDLLTFSRMVNNPDATEPTDFNRIFQEVESDLSMSIAEHQAEIHCDPLPELMAHPNQIRQLFINLLSNALKFSKSTGKVVIEIRHEEVSGQDIPGLDSEIRKEQRYHRFQVIDNGIGFEPEYAEKIFVIFQRLHGKSSYSGTGIGLAICRRVVTNHGGYIFAEGKPGEGAIFTFYLPSDSDTEGFTID
ncbi:sensor histidine kinase [Siphonobacter aquaeclarae]|uniref:histidine kinase n=1 Tax=Siphonobacter aquaeclarae TaxID=563176 RepID=A0A1G9X841_9BACT|nr:sensor histidine kinase [Siphonobacter aquaeclarae]SDM92505.1 His Kinase A (phospho-acceptor) domain-containing protein [Siphonobacter aquaeclarae]